MRPLLVDASGAPIGVANRPPHPLQGIRRVFGTRGVPSVRHGSDGDLATDPTTGKVYARSASGWAFKGQGFQRLFQPSSGQEFSTGESDPTLPGGFSYAWSTSMVGNSVLLSWYLTGASSFPISGAETTAAQASLYIQKSSSKTNNPLAPGFFSFNIGHGTLSPEAGWTTLQSYSPGSVFPGSNVADYTVDNVNLGNAWVGTYQDDDPFPGGVHIANYRLVYFFFNSTWFEFDWPAITVTKHYNVTATIGPASGGGNQATISWA